MATIGGYNVVTDGLVFAIDAANSKSYISGSNTAYSTVISQSLVSAVSCSLVNGVAYSSNNNGFFIFDGSDDRILIENTPQQSTGIRLGSGNIPWMVNVWIRTSVAGSNNLGQSPILTNRSGGPVYCNMGLGSNGAMKYDHYSSGAWQLKTGSIAVNDNRWHMLSWVNLNNSTMNLYVDTIFDTNISSSIQNANNPVDIIGSSWGGATINASIAYLSINIGRLYGQEQVIQNYNATKGRFGL